MEVVQKSCEEMENFFIFLHRVVRLIPSCLAVFPRWPLMLVKAARMTSASASLSWDMTFDGTVSFVDRQANCVSSGR